ncbi:maltose-binding periplasmic protein [Halobacteroides halobius DSM 5150]|uniref:Maltose-binding periplasmic protein n=1 Tax=Halobacteroides halobius (strain ATCC 35273 / DSM 5150 / MD-1) TaxID=748449 RepID=L0K4Z8_HALHC|nr:extracellular solute-binding protein [Halobacteroides halobius]AGB40096.1 maltose-binding periplasmic protein [Halobacteroides halobius DSM 5150]
MKKRFSVVLIAILALSLVVVGCGSNKEAAPKKDTEEKAVALDKRELSKQVTIKFWEKESVKFDKKTMTPLIKKFEKKYPNINVDRTHMGIEDLRKNTQTAYMGGKGPDVVWSPFDHIGPFSAMGIAQPLDKLMSDELKNRYIDSALPGMSLKGNVYGVPVTMGNHLMLYYNKDLVNQVPKTWEELIKIAKKATKDTTGDGKTDQYGLVYNSAEPFWWVVFHGGFGGWVFDKEYNPTLDTKATKQAMQFVHDLEFEHKIIPKECGYNVADSLFKKGKAAFIINGVWALNGYTESEKIDAGVAVLPKFEATGKYAQPMTSGAGLIMMSGLPEAKQIAVMKFIKFMTSQEAQKTIVKHHKRLPSNKVVYDLPVIKNNPVMKVSGEQLRKGRAMPVVPEMRAVWDAIRPALQSVMSGDLAPAKAPAKIQETAEKKIKQMK